MVYMPSRRRAAANPNPITKVPLPWKGQHEGKELQKPSQPFKVHLSFWATMPARP